MKSAEAEVKAKLNSLKTASVLQKMSRALGDLQRTKTLTHTSDSICLADFYYPASIVGLVSGSTTARPLRSLSDLPERCNLLIEGTVGQGKSVFLRWLACEELRAAARLPVFYELRRLNAHVSLEAGLANTLINYGAPANTPVMDTLAATGAITLLLDGYDEIPAELVAVVSTQIEEFCKRYPLVQVIATSRPESTLRSSPHFRVVQLAPLTKTDHEPFLRRVAPKDGAMVDDIVKSIRLSPQEITAILTTPLIMNLLVLVYRSEHDIPPTLAQLYQRLFWAIVTGHENGKVGRRGNRRTAISDAELEALFRAFCFWSKVSHLRSFDRKAMQQVFDRTLKSVRSTVVNLDQFVEDMVKHVCLLQQDGLDVTFTHPSIQEYFAAEFVQLSETAFAEKFYTQIREKRHWNRWRQELNFLTEIDRYRYTKHFFVPDCMECLSKFPTTSLNWSVAVENFLPRTCTRNADGVSRTWTLSQPSSSAHEKMEHSLFNITAVDSSYEHLQDGTQPDANKAYAIAEFEWSDDAKAKILKRIHDQLVEINSVTTKAKQFLAVTDEQVAVLDL